MNMIATRRSPAVDRNWALVGAGALMTCVAIGVLFSLAVFLNPMSADTGWSRSGISGAMTLAFISMGLASFAWGALSDRAGPARVAACGVALLGLATVLASRASSLLQFQLSFGVLAGIAAGALVAPIVAATANSFERHRNLAVSLVSAGIGVAPMTIAPLAAWLVLVHGWRQAMLMIGIGTWVLLALAIPFVRTARADAPAGVVPPEANVQGRQRVGDAMRSREFLILAAAYFACCAAHSGPIFHTMSYAVGCGIPVIAAVTIYSVEGVGGLFGRLLLGVLADKVGAKRVLIAGLLVQAFAAAAYLLVHQLDGFYAVAFVFGLTYGGVMPLYASLARQSFSPGILGAVIGALSMVSSMGMALGPLAGGLLFDRFGSYSGMYGSSLVLGLVAAAVALMFPRRRLLSALVPAV